MIAAFYDILMILPLMLAGYSVAYDFIPVPEETTGIIKYILPLLICALFISFKHLKSRGRILMSGILLAALLAFFLSLPAGERLEQLLSYMHVFRFLLVCIGCYTAGEILNRFLKARGAVAVLLAAALFIARINGYDAGKMCVCMILMYLLLNLADLYQFVSQKEGDTDRKKHLVFIAPFICGTLIILALLPAPEKPYEWKLAKRIGSMVRAAVEEITGRLFTDGESEEVFIGFSGRGDLSGKIRGRNTVALKLHTTGGYDDNLYLAGTTFREFTGTTWEEDTEDADTDSRFDAVETMCAVLEEDDDGKLNDAVMKVSINVEYAEIKNRALFLPSKSYVVTEAAEGAGYSYRSMYYRLNRRYEKYEELMVPGEEITPERWQAALENLGLDKDESLSYEKYLEYREKMTERYLVETAVSERMREYLDSELEGLETDHEKCVKLATILRGGVYTNEPGELPQEINDAAGYLDHFIFENKAGYCSHYATAFVLMARSIGLPARYVQGFRTTVGRKSDTEVRSEAAHAWAEVYIKGAGWIIFEPTPGYEVKSGWKVASGAEQEKAAEEEALKAAEGQEEKDREAADGEEEIKAALPIERILIPVLAGALLALILWALDCLYKRKKYLALSEKDKCLYLCRQYLNMYRRLGYEREENETIGEFRIRAGEVIEEEQLDFLETYERLLYADILADEKMRQGLEDKKDVLRTYIKKKKKELKEMES